MWIGSTKLLKRLNQKIKVLPKPQKIIDTISDDLNNGLNLDNLSYKDLFNSKYIQ
jgi:hypothetical protein